MPEIKIDKVHQQFDTVPYPLVPLDKSPRNDINSLFINSITSSNYLRNQTSIEPEGKLILDAGCGTGYKSLALAEANPGAKIIGIDLSQQSVDVAQQRLHHHGFSNAEFFAMPLEQLSSLGLAFDYINCDDTLYFLPDPLAGLKAMQSVLQPTGIIRANLHSVYQRSHYYRAQKLSNFLRLMDDAPGPTETSTIRELMSALKNDVSLKANVWMPNLDVVMDDEFLAQNFLLQGDKGSTISEMFELIEAADLEFINMVNWKYWDILHLFKDRQNIPDYLNMVLAISSPQERLYLYELLHPTHRLLDFWCGHVGQSQQFTPVIDWDEPDWENAKAYIHPQLKNQTIKSELDRSISMLAPFEITDFLNVTSIDPISLFGVSAICLNLLWDRPLTVTELAQQWLQIKPLNWVTKEPLSESEAFQQIWQVLIELEHFMFVLLETKN